MAQTTTKIRGSDKLSKVVAILGLVTTVFFGLMSLWLAQQSIEATVTVAERSGSFDRPNLELFLGDKILAHATESSLFVGTQIKQDMHLGFLSFTVVNNGEKSAWNVSVSIGFPEFSRRNLFDILNVEVRDTLFRTNIKRSDQIVVPPMSYTVHEFDEVNPGGSIAIDQPWLLTETSIKDRVEVEFKDKVKGAVDYKLDYGLEVEARIAGDDLPVKSYKLVLYVFDASSEDAFNERVTTNAFKQLSGQRASMPFPSSFFSPSASRVYAVYADSQKVRDVGDLELHQTRFAPENVGLFGFSIRPIGNTILRYGLGVVGALLTLLIYFWRPRRD